MTIWAHNVHGILVSSHFPFHRFKLWMHSTNRSFLQYHWHAVRKRSRSDRKCSHPIWQHYIPLRTLLRMFLTMGWKIFKHPLYSPNFSPHDCDLIPPAKAAISVGNNWQTERTFYQQLYVKWHRLVCHVKLVVFTAFLSLATSCKQLQNYSDGCQHFI